MGRLDNIIARDRERRRLTANKVVWMAIALLVVVVAVLLLFTDVGRPAVKHAPPHVEDVKLYRGH
jgi:hypothetical protein